MVSQGNRYLQEIPFDGRKDYSMVKSVTLKREKMQWHFIKINSKNMYAENVKNKEIVNFDLKDS